MARAVARALDGIEVAIHRFRCPAPGPAASIVS